MNTGTTNSPRQYRSVVILGAARSGTNMLRDTLAKIPGVGTWPCDEISYIWRHGNLRFPTDELTPGHATPGVCQFIKRQFDRLADQQGLDCVLEKTCANTLRVGFVNRVLPDAYYIHLLRDGRDAAHSASERWRSRLPLKVVLPKVRYAPLADIPYYAYRFARTSAYRIFGKEKRLEFWGPRFSGMTEALEQMSITEVAALQWQRSVELTREALREVPPHRVITLHYEDLVANPALVVGQLAQFIGKPISSQDALKMTTRINSNSIGRAAAELGPHLLAKIETMMADTLKSVGYKLRSPQEFRIPQAA
ncbi:MAG: sulfotransferase [Planctomycetota bacterium]